MLPVLDCTLGPSDFGPRTLDLEIIGFFKEIKFKEKEKKQKLQPEAPTLQGAVVVLGLGGVWGFGGGRGAGGEG